MNEEVNKALAENRYGWALPNRKECFSDLHEEAKRTSADTFRIENFKGEVASLPIIRVEINLPKYRIANGRTSSVQEEWVTINGKNENFFTDGDPELYVLQEAQHQILESMIGEEGLSEKFKDPSNRQVEPLLLDENGFVINGNRRLCCWREFFWSDPDSYPHFSHVDVVVLPKCEEKELDALESRLQIERDIRSDYSWHAEAKMFREKQRKFGYSTKELAKQYRKQKKEIEELFEIRDLGAEYLETRGKKNIWSELSETEHTFKRLNKTMKEQQSAADREVLKQLAFSYIDDPDAAGERLYTFIPTLGKHLSSVKDQLRQEFSVESDGSVDSQAEDAFGGGAVTGTQQQDMQLVAQIHSSSAELTKAHDIIVSTLESEKEKLSDKAKSDFLMQKLQKSQTALIEAVNLGLTPEATIDGASAQLDEIEASITKIRTFLATRNN